MHLGIHRIVLSTAIACAVVGTSTIPLPIMATYGAQPGTSRGQLTAPIGSSETLLTYHPRSWYADCLAGGASCSSDGRFLLYSLEGRILLFDKNDQTSVPLSGLLGWDDIQSATWVPSSTSLNVLGHAQGQFSDVVFDLDSKVSTKPPRLKRTAYVLDVPSLKKSFIVGEYEGKSGIWVVKSSENKPTLLIPIKKKIIRGSFKAWAISPKQDEIAYLVQSKTGWFDLWLVGVDSGKRRRIAQDLDTTYTQAPMIGYSPSGEEILVSLVGARRGTIQDKQNPNADRDLDIFAISRRTQVLRPIVVAPGEDLIGGVVGNRIVWTNSSTSMRTGVLPIQGGKVRPLLGEQTSYAYWHPDGDRISVMYGSWSLADWALNWDLGVVPVNSEGQPTGAMKPVVTGNHEDFALVWSPDAKWMAYHSHRAASPGANYMTKDSTDDIWIRRTDSEVETKLTSNVGFEVCQPDWAPNGKQIVFVAIKRRAGYRAVIVDFDPVNGKAISTKDFTVPGIESDVVSATWAPSGTELALEEQDKQGNRKLWLVDIKTKKKTMLAEYRSLTEIGGTDFTPDGKEILFTALTGDHHQLFKVPTVAGSKPYQLTHGDEEHYTPQVSPDGRLVTVTVYTHTKTVKTMRFPE